MCDLFVFQGKCYSCSGNHSDCGNEISFLKNETAKLTLTDCGVGDCWAYRMEEGSTVTFKRECSKEVCSPSYKYENCKTALGKKICKKCCKGEKCNKWFLDGQAGVNSFKAFSNLIKILTFCVLILNH